MNDEFSVTASALYGEREKEDKPSTMRERGSTFPSKGTACGCAPRMCTRRSTTSESRSPGSTASLCTRCAAQLREPASAADGFHNARLISALALVSALSSLLCLLSSLLSSLFSVLSSHDKSTRAERAGPKTHINGTLGMNMDAESCRRWWCFPPRSYCTPNERSIAVVGRPRCRGLCGVCRLSRCPAQTTDPHSSSDRYRFFKQMLLQSSLPSSARPWSERELICSCAVQFFTISCCSSAM